MRDFEKRNFSKVLPASDRSCFDAESLAELVDVDQCICVHTNSAGVPVSRPRHRGVEQSSFASREKTRGAF